MGFATKQLSVHTPIEVGRRTIKRYHVDQPGRPIEPHVERVAYKALPGLVPAAGDGATPEAGWMVLHRGGDTGAYLNVYSWVWDNVIEFHAMAAGQAAVGCPDDDPSNFVPLTKPWIGCVWELAVLEHERSAWVRHMLAPERPDVAAYLGDAMAEGPVGW